MTASSETHVYQKSFRIPVKQSDTALSDIHQLHTNVHTSVKLTI